MSGTQDFAVFAAASVALWFSPGPDTMYILARSVAQGRSAGIVSAMGIGAGLIVHTLLAALGVSAVLAASTTAFAVLKWGGAAYLVGLGLTVIFKKRSGATEVRVRPQSRWIVFRQGLATNVLNPKVAIFFLALLPQFVDPTVTRSPTPFFLLGAYFVAGASVWNVILAVIAARASRSLREKPRIMVRLERLAGLVYIALGLRLLRTAPAQGSAHNG